LFKLSLSNQMMTRRDAVRLLATAAAFPLVPGGMLATLRQARAAVAPQAVPRTLNAAQQAMVRTMAEMILPRTDTPGATDVGVCEFVDLILTEWYDETERSRFLDGLANVNARSQSLFGNEFVGCPPMQQAEILIELGEKMIAEVEAGHSPRPRRGNWSSKSNESFYSMLRRLTLTAYYTSEAGATQELHFQIIPDRHEGCAPEDGEQKAEHE
jgi:hypothetical protein